MAEDSPARRSSAPVIILAAAALVASAALLVFALAWHRRAGQPTPVQPVAALTAPAEQTPAAGETGPLAAADTSGAGQTTPMTPPGPPPPPPAQPVAVPHVVAYTQDEAVHEVRNAGLEPTLVGTPSGEQPEGTVVNQYPPGGSPAPADKQVKLYVARKAAPPPPAPPTTVVRGGVYILPQSQYRYLRDSDLNGLSSTNLRLARNEIYARHGRGFSDVGAQRYFDQQGWYQRNPEYDDAMLSEIDRWNIAYIQDYERRRSLTADRRRRLAESERRRIRELERRRIEALEQRRIEELRRRRREEWERRRRMEELERRRREEWEHRRRHPDRRRDHDPRGPRPPDGPGVG